MSEPIIHHSFKKGKSYDNSSADFGESYERTEIDGAADG